MRCQKRTVGKFFMKCNAEIPAWRNCEDCANDFYMSNKENILSICLQCPSTQHQAALEKELCEKHGGLSVQPMNLPDSTKIFQNRRGLGGTILNFEQCSGGTRSVSGVNNGDS